MKPHEKSQVDLGAAPEMLESLAQRLRKDEMRARLFGQPSEPVRVGKFVLKERLGEGSMGVVYVAHDEQLHRTVALKLVRSSSHLPAGPGDEDPSRSRLLREAQAMARLSHPNVVTVFEAGLWEGRVFIAMELVSGRTLRRFIEAERPSVQVLVETFLQAGRALAAAHDRGIVHRDFKPENVIVGDDGRVRVVDFGLARTGIAEGGSLTASMEQAVSGSVDAGQKGGPLLSTVTIAGTPAYMAPEQYRGEAVDGRADQFAFCVALHEALFGERPFSGGTVAELQESVSRGFDESAWSGKRRLPGWLSKAIARGLSARPEDRWPSMRALLDELGRPRASRRRSLLLSLSATALVLFVWLVVALSRRPANNDAPGRNPEALALYQRAMSHLHDNGPLADDMRRATELDPTFAAAHIQLLLGSAAYVTDEDRATFRAAQANRASLTPYQAALLDTLEPVFNRQPSDWAEGARRIQEALKQYPHDGVLWSQLGEYEAHLGLNESAFARYERALAEEPGLRHAVTERGYVLLLLGRDKEARAALSDCAYGEHSHSRCTMMLAHVLATTGECEAMEGLARQMVAQGAGHGEEQWILANSLAGQGKSKAAVRESAERAALRVDVATSLPMRAVFRFKAAVWAGDFEAAMRASEELDKVTAGSNQRFFHGAAAGFLGELLYETGRGSEAGEVAMRYLDREDAFEPNPTADDTAIAEDSTPLVLAIALRTGRISREEHAARRAKWLSEWEKKVAPRYRGTLWLEGYVDVVWDEATAREAMEVLPRYEPLPPIDIKSFASWGVGAARLLTGDARGAIPLLTKTTRSCRGLWAPFEHTRAFMYLGQAEQQTGDLEGACRSYRVVLDRWGKGPVRSVTADRVRALMREARCLEER